MQSHSFRDFDAFASAVRDIDAVMMFQNPKRRLWSIDYVCIDLIDVQLGRLGSGNIVEGQSWAHGTLIYLPISPSVTYSANGKVLGQNEFMVLEPGCEFCISTELAHDWCSIFVPSDKLMRYSNMAKPYFTPVSSNSPQCRIARTTPQVASRFWSILNQTLVACANSRRFKSSPAAKSAAEEIAKFASLILGVTPVAPFRHMGRPSLPRADIIRSSRELFEERAGEPVYVTELAAAAGVSERTLRDAFHDYYGVGPVRYMQLRQLHQVHQALRDANPTATCVSCVLTDNGVWEFGRFARRYQRHFGELPSQTLRSAVQ